MEEQALSSLSSNWKTIVVIALVIIALVLFILVGTKSAVSPDVAYFPT
jgi:hypothetical protein